MRPLARLPTSHCVLYFILYCNTIAIKPLGSGTQTCSVLHWCLQISLDLLSTSRIGIAESNPFLFSSSRFCWVTILLSGPLWAHNCSSFLCGPRSSEPLLLIQNIRQCERSNILIQFFSCKRDQPFLMHQKAHGTHRGPQAKPTFLHLLSLEISSDFHLEELKENFPSFLFYLPSPWLFVKRGWKALPDHKLNSQKWQHRALGLQTSCSVQCSLERRGSQRRKQTAWAASAKVKSFLSSILLFKYLLWSLSRCVQTTSFMVS